MQDLQEKFSQSCQISVDQVKIDNETRQFNENKAADAAIRLSWKKGSRLEVHSKSTNKWHKGRVIHEYPEDKTSTTSLLPRPILHVNYVSKVLCNKRAERKNMKSLRPSTQDIEDTKAKNKLAFVYRRDPKYDVNKLNEIKNNIFNRKESHQNKYYERLVQITKIMRQAKNNKDNYLTPKNAWIDVVKIIGCKGTALDPFIGDDAQHILWCQQFGLTLKQYLVDFFNIQYLPKHLQCIVSNSPYSPFLLKKIFLKLKIMIVIFALLVPKWVIAEPWFWNIWNEEDNLCFFQPKEDYRFELYTESGKREQYTGKSKLKTIWIFGNFTQGHLKFTRQMPHYCKTDGKQYKLMRIFIE
eukprot:131175_1